VQADGESARLVVGQDVGLGFVKRLQQAARLVGAGQVRRAEPWTGSAECYGSVASIRRITSLYPPYNSSLVGGSGLQERKAKSHSFLVRRPTRRSRGRGVAPWPVSPSLVRPRPLARAWAAAFFYQLSGEKIQRIL